MASSRRLRYDSQYPKNNSYPIISAVLGYPMLSLDFSGTGHMWSTDTCRQSTHKEKKRNFEKGSLCSPLHYVKTSGTNVQMCE